MTKERNFYYEWGSPRCVEGNTSDGRRKNRNFGSTSRSEGGREFLTSERKRKKEVKPPLNEKGVCLKENAGRLLRRLNVRETPSGEERDNIYVANREGKGGLGHFQCRT